MAGAGDCGIIARLSLVPTRVQDCSCNKVRKAARLSRFQSRARRRAAAFSGIFDVASGILRDGAGVFITGLALTIYAVALLRDMRCISAQTGQPAMRRARMNKVGTRASSGAERGWPLLVRRCAGSVAQFFS